MSANNMILKDSTVVVTGGNGSFGKELEKRLKDMEEYEGTLRAVGYRP